MIFRVRLCLAAALCALGLGGPAQGSETRDTVARKFGEAFALADRCLSLKANTTRMGAYTALLGLKVDATFESVVTVWRNRTLTELVEASDADACRLGQMRYGAKGSEGPGLLNGG
ncbi:MAG: hypothetical protein LCH86_07565 [Proteobacteria bacterium]|nr:hypothetical protein [Pseudomonadota bacterium]